MSHVKLRPRVKRGVRWEVVEYGTQGFVGIFKAPTKADFRIKRRHERDTRRAAMETVKGLNAVVETIDAPYLPIKVYRVAGGSRKLVWQQEYDPN